VLVSLALVAVLAALVGFFLLVKGIFDITVAFITKEEFELWWLQLIIGLVEILLAFWVAGNFREKTILLVVYVGVIGLSRGITELIVAFKLIRGDYERTGNYQIVVDESFPLDGSLTVAVVPVAVTSSRVPRQRTRKRSDPHDAGTRGVKRGWPPVTVMPPRLNPLKFRPPPAVPIAAFTVRDTVFGVSPNARKFWAAALAGPSAVGAAGSGITSGFLPCCFEPPSANTSIREAVPPSDDVKVPPTEMATYCLPSIS
jgi:hypothetical protein